MCANTGSDLSDVSGWAEFECSTPLAGTQITLQNDKDTELMFCGVNVYKELSTAIDTLETNLISQGTRIDNLENDQGTRIDNLEDDLTSQGTIQDTRLDSLESDSTQHG